MARPTTTHDDSGYSRPRTVYPTTDYHAARERVAAADYGCPHEQYELARRRIAEARLRREQRNRRVDQHQQVELELDGAGCPFAGLGPEAYE